jgi:hypothetical protein
MPTSRADLKFIGDLELETFSSSNQVPTLNLDSNFTALRQKLNLLVDYCKNNTISLGESNTYTAKQTFNIESDFVQGLRTPSIQAINLNTTSALKKNGTSAKWTYEDGSSDEEIASKGYVQSVAFVAGNVPAGGTAKTWLEGNSSWTDPRTFTPWETKTTNFTAVDKGQYSVNGGINIQIPAITATLNFRVKPAIGQDLTVSPFIFVRADGEKIANDAANFTGNLNGIYEVTSNGTDIEIAFSSIGRV